MHPEVVLNQNLNSTAAMTSGPSSFTMFQARYFRSDHSLVHAVIIGPTLSRLSKVHSLVKADDYIPYCNLPGEPTRSYKFDSPPAVMDESQT